MSSSIGSSIASFVPDYPDQTADSLQAIVATRREFAETAARVREPIPERGQVLAHQLLFARIMRLYPRQLLLSDPGTGKTISFETYTEYLRKAGTCRHAYILESGKQALENAKLELIHKILPPNRTGGAATMPREVADFYTFSTYGKFVKEVSKMTDAAIGQHYSGCAFVCDEAHNLSASNKSSKRYPWLEKVLRLAKRTYIILATATPMVNSPKELAPLMNLILPPERMFPPNYDFNAPDAEVDVAKRCENFVSYVRSELSLVRTQFVGEEFCVISGASAREDAVCTLKGRRVIRSKAASSRSNPEPSIVERRIVVKTSIIGDIQRAAYVKRRIMDDAQFASGTDILEVVPLETEDEISDSVYNRTIQASLFVFPDGSYGGHIPGVSNTDTTPEGLTDRFGAGKYVTFVPQNRAAPGQSAGSTIFQFNSDTDIEFRSWSESGGARSFRAWIGGAGRPAGTPVTHNLARLSAKFAAIVDIELQHAKDDGTSFVYSEIKNGGGAILLGLCFEQFGYSRYVPNAKMEKTPALRYALMLPDPDVSKAAMTETLRVFNSPENADGSIIKVMIGSRVSRESITIKHAIRAHELTPPWTRSAEIQALGRVTRAGSHDALQAFKVANGEPESELTVFMYRHAVVIPSITTAEAQRISTIARIGAGITLSAAQLEKERDSIDLYIHRVAAGKDFQVRRIMRGLKRAAIDCMANYNRNVTVPYEMQTITDGSAECDYDKCQYQCIGAKPTATQIGPSDETYEIMFASSRQMVAAKDIMTDAFLYEPVMTVNTIRQSTTEPFLATKALLESIETYQAVSDPLRRVSYLAKTASGEVIAIPDIDLAATVAAFGGRADPWISDYARFPLLTISREFKDAVSMSFRARDWSLLTRGAKENGLDGALSAAARATSYTSLLNAFERAFASKQLSRSDDPVGNVIYESLKGEFLPYLTETSLNKLRETLRDAPAHQVGLGLPDESNVFFGTALVEEERAVRGEYSVTARKGEAGTFRAPAMKYLRVFIPDEGLGGWRYAVDPDEIYAFDALRIAHTRRAKPAAALQTRDDAPFSGTVQAIDGTFRIIDRSAREKSWGRNCSTLKIPYIVSLIVQISPDATPGVIFETIGRHPEGEDSAYFATVTKPVDAAYAKSYYSELTDAAKDLLPDLASRINATQLGKIKRDDLCAYLRKVFDDRNLTVTV